MKFNERLKAIRKRSKKTQQSIANHLNITLRTYQRYEEGSIEPPLSAVTSIAEFLDIPTDCLFGIGLFSNWEDILSHKEAICESLEKDIFNYFPFPLISLPEGDFAKLLAAACKRIEITDEEIHIYPTVDFLHR